MDIEITPDQPKFCPHCHGETSLLTVGVMARHDLHVPARPVDLIKGLERSMAWGMILPAVVVVMFATTGYCVESHCLDGGAFGLKSVMLLSGGATLVMGLGIKKFVVHQKRIGAKYLEYEIALEKWQRDVESFQRLRVCEACQVLIDGKESIPLEGCGSV